MKRKKTRVGEQFGRLLAFEKVLGAGSPTRYLCICDCGAAVIVNLSNLTAGKTRSCGCLYREIMGSQNRTHGMSGTASHKCWKGMLQRCTNPNNTDFHYYGGRGIAVCERWMSSFQAFFDDMGARPIGGRLDRINNDGNYEPGNCRWATQKEQMRNTRRTNNYEIDGKTKCLSDWCAEYGISRRTVHSRLLSGMPIKSALTKPVRKMKWFPRTNSKATS